MANKRKTAAERIAEMEGKLKSLRIKANLESFLSNPVVQFLTSRINVLKTGKYADPHNPGAMKSHGKALTWYKAQAKIDDVAGSETEGLSLIAARIRSTENKLKELRMIEETIALRLPNIEETIGVLEEKLSTVLARLTDGEEVSIEESQTFFDHIEQIAATDTELYDIELIQSMDVLVAEKVDTAIDIAEKILQDEREAEEEEAELEA